MSSWQKRNIGALNLFNPAKKETGGSKRTRLSGDRKTRDSLLSSVEAGCRRKCCPVIATAEETDSGYLVLISFPGGKTGQSHSMGCRCVSPWALIFTRGG